LKWHSFDGALLPVDQLYPSQINGLNHRILSVIRADRSPPSVICRLPSLFRTIRSVQGSGVPLVTIRQCSPRVTDVTPFSPRIWTEHGATFYEDGRVFGAIDEHKEGNKAFLVIHEWTSREPGNGHTVEALRWLRARYSALMADGVGSIDEDGIGDIATGYWEHMRERGLVDVLILDDGSELAPPTRSFP
jgi:hypothetical protein